MDAQRGSVSELSSLPELPFGKKPLFHGAALTALLALSAFLLLQNLGSPYITLWDEAIQVNIVKNLAEHSWRPQLHTSAAVESLPGAPGVPDIALEKRVGTDTSKDAVQVGTDYRDWTNNTVWLHKPLFTFYLTAIAYKYLGGSLWALRLPGAIFAWLTIIVIDWIGRRFFSGLVGLAAAAIFGLNPYTLQLVHGQEYAGFPDLALTFFLSIALFLLCSWTTTRSVAALRLFGLAIGFAYLCKGGLALAPFVVLAALTLLAGSRRDLFPILQSIAIFVVVALPERLFWSRQDPLQFAFEGHAQLSHLFIAMEGHSGNLGSYLLFLFPAMLDWFLAPIAYFSLAWSLLRYRNLRTAEPALTLALWVLAYLLPLTFAASRVENFIFAVLPAVALLMPFVLQDLLRSRRFSLLGAVCVSAIATMAAYDLTASMRTGADWHKSVGFILLATMMAAFGVTWALLSLPLLSQPHSASTKVALAGLAITTAVLLTAYVHDDLRSNEQTPDDTAAQSAVRDAALDLRPLVNRNALVLIHSDRLDYAYLYLMYWSGTDALDVCRQPDPAQTLTDLKRRKDVYVITGNHAIPDPVAQLPIGNLYSLGQLPAQTLVPMAAETCWQSR
ncbi:MAG TPA: glycosyltransferase family 39 protein [Acidobacteriaceae bacterium]|jgi:4-amino-4-deoxy-L-arabinose transferase-like glycosyltransferase|nr:glycosyltransferase family 39 protein [Acidobacteriaceae bacterium]